jgi:hypothetical protein
MWLGVVFVAIGLGVGALVLGRAIATLPNLAVAPFGPAGVDDPRTTLTQGSFVTLALLTSAGDPRPFLVRIVSRQQSPTEPPRYLGIVEQSPAGGRPAFGEQLGFGPEHIFAMRRS